ncbi:MAG TPA: DUF6602 domain-containing protein [Patescibacteria group bacterium]|nr:DUF6602 domain-containing protein [Patescibacteria group bacterium]
MEKIDIKNLFYDLQKQMIAKLSTNRRNIVHPGAKGGTSELNWILWLRDYLPKRYCVDKAFIIDSDNNISDEIDVVIYDQQYTPFVFKQDSIIYIPAESVYAIFEVKQKLSKEYILYSGEKAASVRALKRTTVPIPHAGGILPAKPHNKILAGVLTLSSVWKDPLGACFEEHIRSLTGDQCLDIGCALECGSFIVNHYSDNFSIEKSTMNESFIYFFLKLLIELQRMATIPAMDIESYARALDSI